jgi:hypothetical protein
MRYIFFGDGGSQKDPANQAQQFESFLGKILRIDVDAPPEPGKTYTIPADNPFANDSNGTLYCHVLVLRSRYSRLCLLLPPPQPHWRV